jgi:hypothetical protein
MVNYVQKPLLTQLNTYFKLLMEHPQLLVEHPELLNGMNDKQAVGAPVAKSTALNAKLSAKVEPEEKLRNEIRAMLKDVMSPQQIENEMKNKNLPQLQVLKKEKALEYSKPMPTVPRNTAG